MNDVASEWFADESFWQTTFPHMFPPSRFAAAAAEVDQLLALAGCSGGRVLDLACGPGRHAIELAARGFAVTGVDRSAFLLAHARARAAAQGLTIEWVHADMRDVELPGGFDLALSLFTSFGFFADDADNQRVLAQVAGMLRPGGTLVLDVGGKEVLARIFEPTASREVPGGLVVHRRRVTDDWCRLANEWLLVEDGRVTTFRFQHWIYSARELREMCRRAGFASIAVYADYAGAPYGPEASRLVIVAQTAGTAAGS